MIQLQSTPPGQLLYRYMYITKAVTGNNMFIYMYYMQL